MQVRTLIRKKHRLETKMRRMQSEFKVEMQQLRKDITAAEKMTAKTPQTPEGPARNARIAIAVRIEAILTEHDEPLHLKRILELLRERGCTVAYQSASGILQMHAKAGKKFVKVAPATYSLIEKERKKPVNLPQADAAHAQNAANGRPETEFDPIL